MLDSLLTGPSNFNMFGAVFPTRLSPLPSAAGREELACCTWSAASIDPFLHTITIVMHPERTVDEVLAAVDEEIYRLQDAALRRRAGGEAGTPCLHTAVRVRPTRLIGFAEMIATYDWFLEFLDRLDQVTPDDVQRMVRIIWLPTGSPGCISPMSWKVPGWKVEG